MRCITRRSAAGERGVSESSRLTFGRESAPKRLERGWERGSEPRCGISCDEELGEALRELRVESGLTWATIEERGGHTASVVLAWENAKHSIQFNSLVRYLKDVYGMKVEELFFRGYRFVRLPAKTKVKRVKRGYKRKETERI